MCVDRQLLAVSAAHAHTGQTGGWSTAIVQTQGKAKSGERMMCLLLERICTKGSCLL